MKDLLPLSRYSITLIWALLSAIVILASIYLCDGRLIYTLDDPYIHLKVAQTILRGRYGINFSDTPRRHPPCSSADVGGNRMRGIGKYWASGIKPNRELRGGL
jgi:hypothetical protein